MGIDDHGWMRLAYEQALIAQEQGEVPVGAVLVSQNNELLASGYNQVIMACDPTAHAELVVLRKAAKKLKNYRLEHCRLYVTLEPCAMCAGAILHARLQRLIFATRDFKAGAAGSVTNLFHPGLPYPKLLLDEGIMQQECAHLLSQFFAKKRKLPPPSVPNSINSPNQ